MLTKSEALAGQVEKAKGFSYLQRNLFLYMVSLLIFKVHIKILIISFE